MERRESGLERGCLERVERDWVSRGERLRVRMEGRREGVKKDR